MVEVTDNFLTEDDCYSVVDYCKMASYSYGEVDFAGANPLEWFMRLMRQLRFTNCFSLRLRIL